MVKDLNLDVQILVAPTVRELDGLALSSRNAYLTQDERSRATALYRSLQHAEKRVSQGERSASRLRSGMAEILSRSQPTKVDYVAFVDPKSFKEVELAEPPSVLVALAVWFGSTRLIDNMLVPIS
jgi:pantoate--beta-alanine ligase